MSVPIGHNFINTCTWGKYMWRSLRCAQACQVLTVDATDQAIVPEEA